MSKDVERILSIPEFLWTPEKTEMMIDYWTERLRAPGGTWRLTGAQAQGLTEASKIGGLVGPMAVGAGKTLLSLLLPEAMGIDPADVVVLLPASLKKEALAQRAICAQHFRVPELEYVSYAFLSSPRNQGWLEQRAPRLIIADEAHKLRNYKGSARGRRFLRYVKQNSHTCALVPLSATFIDGEVAHAAHIFGAALNDYSPLPLRFPELERLGRLTDARLTEKPGAGDYRVWAPLVDRYGGSFREALQARWALTPGVVIAPGSSSDAALVGRKWTSTDLPLSAAMTEAIEDARTKTELPCGQWITDSLRIPVRVKQLSLGFYTRFIPLEAGSGRLGPVETKWRARHSKYRAEISGVLARRYKGLDSPGLVIEAMRADPESPRMKALAYRYAQFMEIKDTWVPDVETIWVDEDWLPNAIDRMLVPGRRTIIWYHHTGVAEMLRRRGFAVAFRGDAVPDADVVVLSIGSHGVGLNLQQYDANIILEMPGSGSRVEQLLGRTHRMGQEAERVYVDVLMHHPTWRVPFSSAMAKAKHTLETSGMAQKLRLVDFSR